MTGFDCKGDVVEASGSLQLCAGQKSGSEAAIHAMHAIFEADDTDAVLLIDASNAFNAINRATSLHNIRVLCPVIAAYCTPLIPTGSWHAYLLLAAKRSCQLKEQHRVRPTCYSPLRLKCAATDHEPAGSVQY